MAVVGLGLIGGSLAKALKKKTGCTVVGFDRDDGTLAKALASGAIDRAGQPDDLTGCQLVFIALYPGDTVDFALGALEKGQLAPGTILSDLCGIKRFLRDSLALPCREKGVHYVGAHPMAGREFSGYLWSEDNLFEGASFIITKAEKSNPESVDTVANLAKQLEFGKIVITTVEEHDRVIAYTSQLAHVVSNAYVKSDTANRFEGYSAGSFQDLTRVARLDPDMWTQLFLMNPQPLSDEIGIIIENLKKYKEAIDKGDSEELRRLLKEGSDIKKRLNGEI